MTTKKQEKQETQVAILTPKKVRGTATIYACGDVEFKAYGEGTPGLANWTWSVRVSIRTAAVRKDSRRICFSLSVFKFVSC